MSHCNTHHHCIQDALAIAAQLCDKNQVRFTELRKRVLELVWASHKPVKAYDIMALLNQGEEAAKPPIVYRALDFLLEQGLVHRINSLNAYVGCSHPALKHQCSFLICVVCQEVQECCNTQLSESLATTSRRKHFKLKEMTVEIQGVCKYCQS